MMTECVSVYVCIRVTVTVIIFLIVVVILGFTKNVSILIFGTKFMFKSILTILLSFFRIVIA